MVRLLATDLDKHYTASASAVFFSFRRLTTLNLGSSCTEERCGVQLNDPIISELAMALPQLTSLMLGGIPCEASTSDVTIASLVEISTHCVGLDILRLHFIANDIISRDYQKFTVQHPQRSLRDHYHQGRSR